MAKLFYFVLLSFAGRLEGQSFSQVLAIYGRMEEHTSHFVDVRPKLNQREVVTVSVGFSILSILEVAELSQSVTYNVYFNLMWKDEVMSWNSSLYGGVSVITVRPTDIWRPRLMVINSVGERELYKDDSFPLQVESTGQVSWMPSGPLATSCSLDLSKYPVDEHACSIKLATMNFEVHTVELIEESTQNTSEQYVENTEWELKDINMSSFYYLLDGFNCSGLQINVYLKRRPISLLLGYIIPVTFISFLNLFVFLIPAESGEKVSAGITVLLSQAMYLSTMSSMLPRSTNPLPVVTYYLFLLIINSTVIVFMCILVVALQSWEESYRKSHQKDTKRKDLVYDYEENIHLEAELNTKMANESPQRYFSATPEPSEVSQDTGTPQRGACNVPAARGLHWGCRRMSECINIIAFFVLFAVWLFATGRLVYIVKT